MKRVTYLIEVVLEPVLEGENPPVPDHDFDNPNLPYVSHPHLEAALSLANGPWCVSNARFDQRVIENVPEPV